MRAWAWGIVAAAGFGLMVGAYHQGMTTDREAPWAAALMAIGEGGPDEAPEGALALPTRVVPLPLSERAEAIVNAMSGRDPKKGAKLTASLQPRLVELPPEEFAPLIPWLRSGRIPEAGTDEILAGAGAGAAETDLRVGGRTFRVVGTLKPDVSLFSGSYLAPAGPALEEAIADEGVETTPATLIRIADADAHPKVRERIAEAYPSDRFQLVHPRIRPSTDAFRLYLAGQLLFLLGGSGLLIALYRRLAARSTSFLAAPLRELAGRPRLLWGVHLAYFGLYAAGAFLGYANPEITLTLTSGVGEALGPKGPGAPVSQAYLSGSIVRAAVVTFLVNFPIGSAAVITLPSLIVPGVGVLLAVVRATVWGLLLGPAEAALARVMIPHTGTLLLEGEGYILATFFALLVPLYLLGSGPIREASATTSEEVDPAREGVFRRFVQAVVMNLKGNAVVAVVLAVAAVYEAVEVIHLAWR